MDIVKSYNEVNKRAYLSINGQVIFDSGVISNSKIGAMSKLGSWYKNNKDDICRFLQDDMDVSSYTGISKNHPNYPVLVHQLNKYDVEISGKQGKTLVVVRGAQWSPKSFAIVMDGNSYPVDLYGDTIYVGTSLYPESFDKNRNKIMSIIDIVSNVENYDSFVNNYKKYKNTTMAIDPHRMRVYYSEK